MKNVENFLADIFMSLFFLLFIGLNVHAVFNHNATWEVVASIIAIILCSICVYVWIRDAIKLWKNRKG